VSNHWAFKHTNGQWPFTGLKKLFPAFYPLFHSFIPDGSTYYRRKLFPKQPTIILKQDGELEQNKNNNNCTSCAWKIVENWRRLNSINVV